MICERVLEEEGVKGDITIGDYAMDWIPCEDDLISMELDPSTWKEIYLDGDQTSIYYAAKSLMRLQSIYGLFPRIIGKGDAAKVIFFIYYAHIKFKYLKKKKMIKAIGGYVVTYEKRTIGNG